MTYRWTRMQRKFAFGMDTEFNWCGQNLGRMHKQEDKLKEYNSKHHKKRQWI